MIATLSAVPGVRRKQTVMIENIEFMLSWGECWAEIVRRLDTTPVALARQLHRLGRHDLVHAIGGDVAGEVAR